MTTTVQRPMETEGDDGGNNNDVVDDDYIGNATRAERQRLFSEVYRNAVQLIRLSRPVLRNRWHEDPYVPESWPSTEEEYDDAALLSLTALSEHYDVGGRMRSHNEGARMPALSVVNRLAELDPGYAAKLARVMPEGSALALKRTKPFGRYCIDAGEKEILVAYHLRELVHNYSHLLSLHFMMVLDWWVGWPSEEFVKQQDVLSAGPRPSQFLICERLDVTLWSRFRAAAFPERHETYEGSLLLRHIRAILFQALSALEIAWLTHRFVHGDLHTGNMMLKKCTADTSPILHDRHWLYRRYNDPDYWYELPPEAHNNQLVKIIDFDRSTLCAPVSAEKDRPLMAIRHNHARLTRLRPVEFSDKTDVADLLKNVSNNEHINWKAWEKEDAQGLFHFHELVRNRPRRNASECLNHAFFAPFRKRQLHLDNDKSRGRRLLVVSFASSFYELNARGVRDEIPLVQPTAGPSDGGLKFASLGNFMSTPEERPLCVVCGEQARRNAGDINLCDARTCYDYQFVLERTTTTVVSSSHV